MAYFRDLLVAACGAGEVPLLSVGNDCREILVQQSRRWGLQTIATGMQILAESKARMQRVSYGRALAELALVRISLLEDLDRLDDLIAQLKGGVVVSQIAPSGPRNSGGIPGTSSPPQPPLPAPQKSVVSKPTIAAPAEKKNDIAAAPVTKPAPKSNDNPDDSGHELKPNFDWKPGCEKDLQSILADRLNDIAGTSVRRASSLAIIGPNVLEFSIPINYDVERKTLERPDTVVRLESILAEVVGQPIRIRFRSAEAVGQVAKPTAVAAPANRTQIVDEPEDAYLQQVTGVFGVKSWKVKDLVVETTEGDSTEAESE